MTLALFDLDNTLLGGDSDHAWGEFLIEEGLVDALQHRRRNDEFYEDYSRGELDIHAYVRFTMEAIQGLDSNTCAALHRRFMRNKIETLILPKATELIEDHKKQGHTLLIITATNRFITGPIAARLQISHLIATDLVYENGLPTGEIDGIPCYQEGKVTRLEEWMDAQGVTYQEDFFYSDSHNDQPLLERVAHPRAVDPDAALTQHAQAKGWPIISLRE